MRQLIFIFCGTLLMYTSCAYHNEEDLYGSANCDTAAISYATIVAPIMTTSCNNCHGGSSPSAGIRLDTYTGVKAQADGGGLVGSIEHASGYSAMPQGASKLSTCNISKIKAWISQGALNN